MKFAVAVSCIVLFFSDVCGNTENDLEFTNDYIYKTAVAFVDECGSKNLSFCLKEKILRYMEVIPSEIDIGEGLRIKPNNEDGRRSRYDRTATNNSEIREEELDKLLTNKLSDYIFSHRLEYKMPPEIVSDLQTAIEEGRKKKGGGGMGMKQILLLFKIKAAILGAIALKLISLVAFKALLMGKIALTIATVITLKNLLEPKHSSSTYEVHSVPYYDEHSPFDRISV